LIKDATSNPKEEIMVFQKKIGVIAKYRRANAKAIMKAYLADINIVTANRNTEVDDNLLSTSY